MLGASVESWDEHGHPVTGQVGELVLTEPLPSMPIYLWGDQDGSRYRESYFSMYPGVWRHGDWIEITSRGGAIIYGRSDSTINRGGVRMGTSEIYRAVLALEEITDALVIDLPRAGTDGWMQLFIVLRAGLELTDELRTRVAKRLREDLLTATRPRRDHRDRRGPAHALRQGSRGSGQAHPHRHPGRAGRLSRVARQPRRAGSVHRTRRAGSLLTGTPARRPGRPAAACSRLSGGRRDLRELRRS